MAVTRTFNYIMNSMSRLVILLLWLPLVASAIPRAINPVDVLVVDSGSVQTKLWPIDSIVSDSVAHADTATFAFDADSSRASHEADNADSSDTAAFAHTAGGFVHRVTPGTVPKAATDSTFTNSHISESGDTVKVFSIAQTFVDSFDGADQVLPDPPYGNIISESYEDAFRKNNGFCYNFPYSSAPSKSLYQAASGGQYCEATLINQDIPGRSPLFNLYFVDSATLNEYQLIFDSYTYSIGDIYLKIVCTPVDTVSEYFLPGFPTDTTILRFEMVGDSVVGYYNGARVVRINRPTYSVSSTGFSSQFLPETTFTVFECGATGAGLNSVLQVNGGLDIKDEIQIDSTPLVDTPTVVLVKSAATGDTIGSFPVDSLKIAVCGSIHHHDDTTTISVSTGAGYTKLGIFPQLENCKNVICDTANDQLILTRNGYYDPSAKVTTYAGTAGVNVRSALFLNGVEQDQTHDEFNFTTANSKQRIICSGLIHVTNAPDTLDLRVRHDNGGSVNLSVTYGNLKAVFVGY